MSVILIRILEKSAAVYSTDKIPIGKIENTKDKMQQNDIEGSPQILAWASKCNYLSSFGWELESHKKSGAEKNKVDLVNQ